MSSPASNPEISMSAAKNKSKRSRRKGAKESETGSVPAESPHSQRDSSKIAADTSSISHSTRSASSSDFNFAHHTFLPSVVALFVFAFLMHVACAQFASARFVACTVATIIGAMMWEWVDLYGPNLSRKERITFDYSNILATSENFDFNKSAIYDPTDPPTPGRVHSPTSPLTEKDSAQNDVGVKKEQ